MKKYWIILLLSLLSATLGAQSNVNDVNKPEAVDNIYLHLKIVEADAYSQPEVWQNYFILSYNNQSAKRFVGVAFDYENYAVIHSFVKNANDTYVFYAKLPEVETIKYRLIVDSVWQDDPKNENFEIDDNGVKISTLNLPQRSLSYKGPQIKEDGTVDFYLNLESGAQVFLMGNFSQWDPFMYPMTEIKAGVYKVSIPLNSGIYYYSFLYNGRRLLDPGNLLVKEMRSTGERVNELMIASKNSIGS